MTGFRRVTDVSALPRRWLFGFEAEAGLVASRKMQFLTDTFVKPGKGLWAVLCYLHFTLVFALQLRKYRGEPLSVFPKAPN